MGRGLSFFIAVFVASDMGYAQVSRPDVVLEFEKRAIAYFVENANPETGLVLDRAPNFDGHTQPLPQVASISATGFGLTVVVNAATRGLVDPAFAQSYSLRALRFVRDHVDRHKGWFLHWLDWGDGHRMWESEYSTIDTALFMAGALYAAQVYPGTEIADIADQLYRDMDFQDMMTDGGTQPEKRTLSMGWRDGNYLSAEWNMYAEEMILILLGLGHPTHPLPLEAWLKWDKSRLEFPKMAGSAMGLDQALFVHQYSHLYIDFRQQYGLDHDYFKNSVQVSRYHRDLIWLDGSSKTLHSGFWGFSAGDGPHEYLVSSALAYKSTVCIGCAIGSAMFLPTEVVRDMTEWINGPYGTRVWGRYGFIDSLDIDQNWFSDFVLGITVGPAYISLVNTEEALSVWKKFMTIPEIQTALFRASWATFLVQANSL